MHVHYKNKTCYELAELLPEATVRQINNYASNNKLKKSPEIKSAIAYKHDIIWSDAEEALMQASYSTASITELLSMFPGKAKKQIYSKAQRMGIVRIKLKKPIIEKTKKSKPAKVARLKAIGAIFTDLELDKLKKNYPTMPKAGLLRMFPGRRWDQIVSRANKLSVKRIIPVERDKPRKDPKANIVEKKPKFGDQKPLVKFENKPIDKSNPVKIGDNANTIIYAAPGRNHDDVRREYKAQRAAALKNFSRWGD